MLRWPVEALAFPFEMSSSDGVATWALTLSILAKVLLALAPVAALTVAAPRWRVLSIPAAIVIVLITPVYFRACPTVWHWLALGLLSGLGVFCARLPYCRVLVGLPMIVLWFLPAREHGFSWDGDHERLAARCAANDGERPVNFDPNTTDPQYYGIHVFPPEWILLTGETPDDGKFLGMPHGGHGSFWLRRRADGTLSFAGPSQVTGNSWTSCLMGQDRWIVRAGMLMRVRPPGTDGHESVGRFPFTMFGFDAPDIACDTRTGAVFASDLFDGRLIELSARTGGRPERRPDAVSERGGAMEFREIDGRLVILDFRDLIVYSSDESQVLQRIPAAMASQRVALCQIDGSAAVPDLAGRLRIFKMSSDGTYQMDWGLDLPSPRFAQFSPDCGFIGVTSANDRDVWIIDRAGRRIVKTFKRGPAIRAAAFLAPRELAVVDACSISLLRF